MVKVLVAGDVKGSVTQLLAKVAQYNKSGAGPFDMVFAVGPLTSPDSGGGDEAALSPVLAGETPPAVPVYFCEAGGSESLSAKLEEHPSEVQQVASNLFYLGRGGIKTVGKLTVAFLSTSHKPDDLESCRKVSAMAGYGGADLLLSTEWGRGMEVDLPERCFQELSAAGVAPAAVGSEAVAKLAVAVKPRYHFAASEGAFFQRPPYRNYGSSGCMHTTRFISLGELAAGSAAPKDKTKKWVHALNLEPIAFMKKDDLSKRSADTTDCPYVARKALGAGGGGGGGSGGGRGGAQGGRGGDRAAWASRISAQEDGRRADSGMFFWGGRGGGRGRGSAGGRSGGPSGPVDPNNRTVFVGNLRSGDVSAEQLEALFSAAGPLSGVRVAPGSSFGFVEFERHEDAANAIAKMEGFDIGGNHVRLSWGNHKSRPSQQGGDNGGYGGGRGGFDGGGGGFGGGRGEDPPVNPDNMSVFVGNLKKDGSTTMQDLKEAFVSAGCKFSDIVQVRLTGKGYAFVEFASHEAAAKAIELMHNQKIKNKPVTCDWSKVNPAYASRQRENEAMPMTLPGAGKSGSGGGPHEADPRQECWFCLASPQLEDHLVCSVADEIYLAQPKGGLVPGHVLIVPVSHQQRYSELSAEGAKEAERYKESFKRYCLSCGCEPFFFERCVPTKGAHHLHIQAVPIPAGEGSRGARILMRSEGTRHGMTFQEVPEDADLRATLKDGPYFYAELPGDVIGSRVRLIHRVPEGGNIDARGNRRHVPLQFGRDVAAKLLSMPERAHWRDCSLPKAKEILQADIFKEAFKAFDFTQQEEDEDPEEDAAAAADGMEVDEAVSGQKRPAGEEGGNGGDEPEKRARGPT